MGSCAGKKGGFHQVGYHGRRRGRIERKELERVKSASSEPGLNFLDRKSALAVHYCDSVPQFLDGVQFEFIDRTCEIPSDVKELLIPDCIEQIRIST